MDETFSIEFRGDHVCVRLGPDYEVTLEQEDEFWASIERYCTQHNSRRVLVEGYLPKKKFETADVVSSGMRASLPELWFAFCLLDFEPTDLSDLFKTIAGGRGVHVKFFSDTERALNWLRSNSPA
jgi:hypothetical protein